MSKGGGGGVNIPKDYTIKVGGDGTTISVDSDLDNIRIKEIAPVTVNSNVAVTQPIVTQSTAKSDAAIDLNVRPLQVTSDSNSVVDVKPLAIDSCQTLKIAPLPPIKMEQPYSQHFGITYMGMEVWGINISGKSESFIHSPAKPHHYVAHGPSRTSIGAISSPRTDPPPRRRAAACASG